jgi:hypothetical protein
VSRGVSIHDIDPSKLGPNSPLLELMRKQRKPASDREHEEQTALFVWIHENEPKHPELRWFFAVPNWIGHHTKRHGARLKAEGRRPGVLDCWWPVSRGGYKGLVIEMKIHPNRLTADQKDWAQHLIDEGWRVEVAYSAEEAQQFIESYLGVSGDA